MGRTFANLRFFCAAEYIEIIIAELSARGFESFIELDDGLMASIEANDLDEQLIKELCESWRKSFDVRYDIERLEEKNWNEEWERSYNPIVVEDQCLIRTTFHETAGDYPFEIIINPKMSFGTGHHDTTYLMLSHQLQLDHKNARVLDAGCGTGILSIMAEKLGADTVLGFDIDPWAFENAKENLMLNDCSRVEIRMGERNVIPWQRNYNMILANINRQVILDHLSWFADILEIEGFLITSGYFTEDKEMIRTHAANYGLFVEKQLQRNKWASLVFQKKSK